MASASIITIGDELLIGQVIDTNSAWIAQELNKIGIPVKRRVAVGDEWDEIWEALDEEAKHSEIILITGGLGPTSDDITKPLLCKYFNGKMIVNEDALQNVKYLFEQIFKRPLTEINIKQAEVPDACTVIQNKKGTAPGMWFEKEGTQYISLPGVPHEMKGMITDDVLPSLQKKYVSSPIVHRTLLTAGVGESFLAEQLKEFEASLPKSVKLAYLPSYGMVRLRLSTAGDEQEINELFYNLQLLVKDYLVTDKDESMAETVAKLLLRYRKTVTTAESCTGGYIAHLITSIAGSSAFYNGSIVSYGYEAKVNLLGVSKETLTNYGAVSEETVKEMLRGVIHQLDTDYGIAVSGIMGPDGGTPDKPVGTVWVAVGSKANTKTHKFTFRFDRAKNIELTGINALNLLRRFIIAENTA